VKEPQEIEDEEHEQVLERVAAVDVARASGWCVPGYPIRPGRAGGAFRPFTRLVAHDGSCFVAAKSAASSAGGYSRGALDRAGWLARSASPSGPPTASFATRGPRAYATTRTRRRGP
jgi:hypothetical protein